MTDEYLKQHCAHSRGKLKIFLGPIAGVGKTYKMLAEAHRRRARGEDIVVGLVETHGRIATAEQLEGLEQVPLKNINYRGIDFFELDTAAVIRRNPEWVVIDELAHTNVPGTVHAKRWQSIEEIRDAGINVITTLNIQHVESVVDTVEDITGVRIRETVPDSVLDSAEDIELVDLTPAAVINRLRRGDIYKGDKVDQALANFFTSRNITALRELAMRVAAEEVDEQLLQYSGGESAADAIRWVICVCLPLTAMSVKLVRKGYGIARRLQADVHFVTVVSPGCSLSGQETVMLNEARELARNFGKDVVILEGDSVVEELEKFVHTHRIDQLIVGHTHRSRFWERINGSLIDKLVRRLDGVEITIITNQTSSEN